MVENVFSVEVVHVRILKTVRPSRAPAKRVDVGFGCIDVERGACRCRPAHLVHQRHRAVVPGANADAFGIEDRGQIVRVHVGEVERDARPRQVPDPAARTSLGRATRAAPGVRARSRAIGVRARAPSPCRRSESNRTATPNAIASAMLLVPASNFQGSSAKVVRSYSTLRIISPPARNGGIASSSARLP